MFRDWMSSRSGILMDAASFRAERGRDYFAAGSAKSTTADCSRR